MGIRWVNTVSVRPRIFVSKLTLAMSNITQESLEPRYWSSSSYSSSMSESSMNEGGSGDFLPALIFFGISIVILGCRWMYMKDIMKDYNAEAAAPPGSFIPVKDELGFPVVPGTIGSGQSRKNPNQQMLTNPNQMTNTPQFNQAGQFNQGTQFHQAGQFNQGTQFHHGGP